MNKFRVHTFFFLKIIKAAWFVSFSLFNFFRVSFVLGGVLGVGTLAAISCCGFTFGYVHFIL